MAKKQSGLGRDLYSLFDDNLIEEKKDSGTTLKISDLEPRKDQPRKIFEREALESLADSIATYGVLQPIIVRENTSFPGSYEIIAGERRWRAAKMAGLSEIPVVILTGDELKMAQISLIENIQRENLNPVEEAAAYLDLIEKFGLTQEQVAKQVGKSRSAITNTLRLLDLPDEILEYLRSGELSAGHARALLPISDEEKQLPPSLRRALAYVRYHYDKKISTADLCAYCNLTPQHLIRLFKKHLGMTPLQYINKSKILHAIELLRTSELSVKEIAYTLGFDNPNYFSRLFTKQESISPAEVRERIRSYDGKESALKVK